jgi:hypothetical protein
VQVGRGSFFSPDQAFPKSEGMVCPVALWKGEGRDFISLTAPPGT